jgi:hypothetical protein
MWIRAMYKRSKWYREEKKEGTRGGKVGGEEGKECG